MKNKAIIPLFIWNSVGRIYWRFNSKKQPETYLESCTRIDNFVDRILAPKEDCFIVAHGFVNKLVISKLKANRFRGLNPIRIKTGVPYEFTNS